MSHKEILETINRCLNVDGRNIRASDVIGRASDGEVRATLAVVIAKLESQASADAQTPKQNTWEEELEKNN